MIILQLQYFNCFICKMCGALLLFIVKSSCKMSQLLCYYSQVFMKWRDIRLFNNQINIFLETLLNSFNSLKSYQIYNYVDGKYHLLHVHLYIMIWKCYCFVRDRYKCQNFYFLNVTSPRQIDYASMLQKILCSFEKTFEILDCGFWASHGIIFIPYPEKRKTINCEFYMN